MSYILRLTDGVTTIDFSASTGQVGYSVAAGGWAPNVATRRRSTLGGAGPYADVVEQIPAQIYGASAADALSRLAALANLLDQAEAWAKGDPVNPVLIQYQPEGGSQLLQAAVLGRPEGGQGLSLPPAFNRELRGWVIDVLDLQLVRRGLWLGAAETVGPGAGVANPGVMSATFATSVPVASPTRISLAWVSAVNTPATVLIANAAARIQLVEAETLTDANLTLVADVAHAASGGNVLRYTPVSLLQRQTAVITTTLPSTCRSMAVFAALRNNSASATFTVQAVAFGDTWAVNGSNVLIDASTTNPRLVYLGTLRAPERPAKIYLGVTASTITGPPTLDMDYVVLLDTTDDLARVISVSQSGLGSGSGLIIDPRALTAPAPRVTTGAGAPVATSGDAWVSDTGTIVAALWLATEAANWTYSAGCAVTLAATRTPACLTPQ